MLFNAWLKMDEKKFELKSNIPSSHQRIKEALEKKHQEEIGQWKKRILNSQKTPTPSNLVLSSDGLNPDMKEQISLSPLTRTMSPKQAHQQQRLNSKLQLTPSRQLRKTQSNCPEDTISPSQKPRPNRKLTHPNAIILQQLAILKKQAQNLEANQKFQRQKDAAFQEERQREEAARLNKEHQLSACRTRIR